MVAEIKPIPEEKKLSSYELAQNLEAIAKFMKDLPLSFIRNVEYEEVEAFDRIERAVVNINNRLVTLQETISVSEETYLKAIEDHYRTTRDAVNNLNERLKQLPEIAPNARLPYNLKEMIDTAVRLSELTDDQWNRVVQLATIFTNPKAE
jgi:NifB/MoaA-like Fe-S oxidoreductase